MLAELGSSIEHIPRPHGQNGWMMFFSIVALVIVFIVTHRSDRKHAKLYGTPREETARVLGNVIACAPHDCVISWAIVQENKSHVLLFGGKKHESSNPLTKERLERETDQFLQRILNENRKSRDQKITLEGIQVDFFGLTDLFREGVVTTGQLKNSTQTQWGLLIRAVPFAGRNLDIFVTDNSGKLPSLPKFRVTGHPLGRAAIDIQGDFLSNCISPSLA